MSNLRAKKLSLTQERALLRKLLNATALNNGSSRIVFIDPRDSSRIIKLAIGSYSFRQNKREVKIWNAYQDDRFARIYEYGRYCIVMERIYHEFDECDDWGEEGTEDLIQWLNDEFGETSDNEQIGQREDGTWTCFDYGFNPGESSQYQCGEATSIGNKEMRRYILEAIDLLQKKQPTNKVDKRLMGYCDW